MLTQQSDKFAPKYPETEFCYTIAQFAELGGFSSNGVAKSFLTKNFVAQVHFGKIEGEIRLTSTCFGIALTMRLAGGKDANLDLLASIPAAQNITIEDSIKYQNELSAYGRNGLAPIDLEKLCFAGMSW
jgi:hypothetical protein